MKQLRKTKIICTIGPATNSEEMIEKLIEAGMNCARINCSHGSQNDRLPIVAKLKKVRKEKNVPLAILLDTKGPEFRIKSFKNGSIELSDGDSFTLTTDEVEGDESKVSLTYKNLTNDLDVGDIVLANDGLVKMQVESIEGSDINCKVIIGGKLSNNKSLNFPDKDLSLEYLSENDKQDLLFAVKNDIDFIACSFVSCAQDIISVSDFLKENGGSRISLIAKIENQSGIDNLDEICKHCDGVMVARGDLGVEIDYDKLPVVQKQIIKKCNTYGKLSITSTEMLESMIENPRPTRAEISDVANAVVDETGAIMLSGETACGKYPIEAVCSMSKIAKSTEASIPYKSLMVTRNPIVEGRTVDAIAKATCSVACNVDAKGIVNLTASGFTSELISAYKPHVDVCSVTIDKREYYKLGLYWGIHPFWATPNHDASNLEYLNIAKDSAKHSIGLDQGDKFVLISGFRDDEVGYTNSLLVETI